MPDGHDWLSGHFLGMHDRHNQPFWTLLECACMTGMTVLTGLLGHLLGGMTGMTSLSTLV